MKFKKIIFIIILVTLICIFISITKFYSNNLVVHIHDTFIIISYRQILLFFAEITGLVILFKLIFKRQGPPKK